MTDNQIRPNNYLVLSILSTIFCCWPLGIPAIIHASNVNSKFAEGDYAGAREASRKAKNWTIWSAIAALLVWIFYFIFLGAALLSGDIFN